MEVRVKPNDTKFDVFVEVDRSEDTPKYFIYKLINGTKLWVTKYKKLDRWHGAKAYVRTWEQSTIIINQIFAGEICE